MRRCFQGFGLGIRGALVERAVWGMNPCTFWFLVGNEGNLYNSIGIILPTRYSRV